MVSETRAVCEPAPPDGYSYPFSLSHVDALTWEQVAAVADQATYLAGRAGANAWVSVAAADAATVEPLQRPEENLWRWITGYVVTIETSRE